MATLILSTVGTLVGGPIGGAVGALLGQAVDSRLLAPKGRQGPRLGDLTVQTSRYGSDIPKLFGRMRVAGTVIWSTDLREDRHRESAAKGQAKTTTYSYSASFAVALSGRPILSVGRIWAEGKLLRGAEGDWKSALGAFRLCTGGEDQAIDPLIAAAEGDTPAYRGIAIAVFEDLQLADFGNRIPSLTFEVTADADAVAVSDVAAALSGGAVAGTTVPSLAGYAAGGDSIRGAIEALALALPVRVRDDGARLILADAASAALAIAPGELGAAADDTRPPRLDMKRAGEAGLPDEVSVAYYEPERDWQSSLQRARRGTAAGQVDRIELPAALSAGGAKAVAERRLATLLAARRTATVRLPPARMGLAPGMRLSIPDLPGAWRIGEIAVEKMAVVAKLVAEPAAAAATATADAGRAAVAADEAAGATVIRLLDLPPLDDAIAIAPTIWVAAAGTAPGWRRAALSLSRDGGLSWQAIGATMPAAVIGRATAALAPGDATLFDERMTIDVELLHAGMVLQSRDDDALVAGANTAMLGDELIQFGRATQIGPRRYRLGRLLRGRRGTEAAMAAHAAGEPFVAIDPGTMLAVPLDQAALGATASVNALGIGDGAAGVTASVVIVGGALRPPSPAHLRVAPEGGGLRIDWTRRSRNGWAWSDGADAPLGEEREAYRIAILADGGTPRSAETDAPTFLYTDAMRAADGGAGGRIEVRQQGAFATGDAAIATFL